jgi:hypothetical protein
MLSWQTNRPELNTLSNRDTALSSTILPSSPQKPDIWTAFLERPLKLNTTLTISSERVAFVAVGHGNLLSDP